MPGPLSFEMRVCAWCQQTMDRTPAVLLGERAVTHGICPDCLRTQLAKLSSIRVPHRPVLELSQPAPAALSPAQPIFDLPRASSPQAL